MQNKKQNISNYNKFEKIAKLSEDELNSILLRRKELKYYFGQLGSGMRFIEPDGHDDILYEIISINEKTLKFKYFEVQFPEKELISTILYIPRNLYIIDENNNSISIKFLKPDATIIMQLHNNTEWEKKLYYNFNIKCLLKIIKVKNIIIKQYVAEIDKLIYENTETKKIQYLKNYITILHEKYNIEKSDRYESLSNERKKEINNEASDYIDNIDKIKNNLKIWIEKCNKYKQLYNKKISDTNGKI